MAPNSPRGAHRMLTMQSEAARSEPTAQSLPPSHETSRDIATPAETSRDVTRPHEISGDLVTPPETSRDSTASLRPQPEIQTAQDYEPAVIPAENSITLKAALEIARAQNFKLELSTLQRRAKHWKALGTVSPVKSILVVLERTGSSYRLDREDFIAWIFNEKENEPVKVLGPSAPLGEVRSDETAARHAQAGEPKPSPPSHRPPEDDSKYTVALEKENALLRDQLTIKDSQIKTLSTTIDATMTLFAQHNTLLQGFQKMLGLQAPTTRTPGSDNPSNQN